MDEEAVKAEAKAHANATVAGDLQTAGSSLTKEGAANAGAVMGVLPKELESAEIVEVAPAGDEWVAHIVYRGEGREVVVMSRWADRGGRPKIVDLEVP